MTARYATAASWLGGGFADDLLNGTPPPRFEKPQTFKDLDLRPGRLIVTGGAPGQGKTALKLQLVLDLLRLNPGLRVLIANVEMPAAMLLERVVARLSGVPLRAVADRVLTPAEKARVRVGLAALAAVAGRLAFLQPPFDLRHVAAAGTEFAAGVLVLDYLQRFTPDGKADQRERLDAVMGHARRLCDKGALVLAAAAVARQKSDRGSTYQGLGLASFRGSSELEFGADACYLLVPGHGPDDVLLKCEKNRYGEPRDVPLLFDRRVQRFDPAGGPAADDAEATARAPLPALPPHPEELVPDAVIDDGEEDADA